MVVNNENRYSGGAKRFPEGGMDGVCSPLSHLSISKSDKQPASVHSPAEYCSYNVKSETVTPGLPGRSETGYPIW